MRSQILQGEPGGREAIFKTRDRSALKVDDSLMRWGNKAYTFSVILMRVCTSQRDPSADPLSNMSPLPTGDFIIKIECSL